VNRKITEYIGTSIHEALNMTKKYAICSFLKKIQVFSLKKQEKTLEKTGFFLVKNQAFASCGIGCILSSL
jgi:hypothetical protein